MQSTGQILLPRASREATNLERWVVVGRHPCTVPVSWASNSGAILDAL